MEDADTDAIDPAEELEATELVFALVAAVGTDIATVSDRLEIELRDEYQYSVQHIRLSELLAPVAQQDFSTMKDDERLASAMDAGNELRREADRDDVLALHAVSEIARLRKDLLGSDAPRPSRLAWILRSLKTPSELETLREIYGSRLVVIAAYSPKEVMLENLNREIASSRKTENRDDWAHLPEDLIERDEKEGGKGGQDVSGTFYRADYFIQGYSGEVVEEELPRTLEIVFGSPFVTPTRDEHAQFLAAGAALRSAEFGRQVGAVIATKSGSVVAVGTNEVPTAGGGSHWAEDGIGNRNYEVSEVDTNSQHIQELCQSMAKRIAEDVLGRQRMAEDGEAGNHHESKDSEEVEEQIGQAVFNGLWDGGLKDLTEFGRATHAEMNAILDAALRGVPVLGTTLYTTTFPCHNCARHIIGAGIGKVVFIEPYTKSRAEQLHDDSAIIGAVEDDGEKVRFQPFVGVAPRRYLEMFDAGERERQGYTPRKDEMGQKRKFEKRLALPVLADRAAPEFAPRPAAYRIKEDLVMNVLAEMLE